MAIRLTNQTAVAELVQSLPSGATISAPDRAGARSTVHNQVAAARLYLSALAYTLVEALRRLALNGTEWAQAQVDTIRRKLFKIGALFKISARRVLLELNSNYPWKHLSTRAFEALRR
jgi:hypothetical protein